MALFTRVTIVGLGLIGGSLGMAIRRKRLSREVVGFSRKRATLNAAKRRGAIDTGSTNLAAAVRDAELVILATPVDAIGPFARRAAASMRPGSILTDVGSTKGEIVRSLHRLPNGVRFVGAHPLAGSERRGIEAAHPRLLDRSICLVTTTTQTDPRALRVVTRLWRSLAGRVVVMDPMTHDRLMAAISHLPHLVAFALMQTADDGARALAPRSFLEATRVAKSDPDLWDDILLSNRDAILTAVDQFGRQLARVRALIARPDRPRLHRFLRHAQRLRTTLHDS